MKTIYSAIQPTARLHLGNYLGAVRNWCRLQQQQSSRCIFALADLHALTAPQQSKENNLIGANSMEMARTLLACGLQASAAADNGNKTILYAQSHVREHAELAWVLNCLATVGQLFRMTQWKDKLQNSGHSGGGDDAKQQQMGAAPLGLLAYPVLQAADILLFKASHVPVGQDQVQHLELCRDLAQLYDRRYNNSRQLQRTFPLPAAILSTSPKIMSLRHPEKKMSKSDRSEQSIIWLTDDKDAIHRKIKRAVTDSTPDTMTYELWRVLSAEGDQTNTRLLQDRHRAFFALSANEQRARAGVQNLWSMSAACMDASLADTYAEFCRQYDDDRLLAVSSLKEFTARNILATLAPIHARFNDLKEDDQAVKQVLKHGAEMAGRIAAETMQQVRRDVGLLRI